MAFLQGKTQKERRNLMLAIALGSVALLGVFYNFVWSGSKSGTKRPASAGARPTPTPIGGDVSAQDIQRLQAPTRIVYDPPVPGEVQIGRNIFAYYSAPERSAVASNGNPVSPVPENPVEPTPIPPSIILSGVSPSSVYARTGDFTLGVIGDKFTPDTKIYLNGTELPTVFESAQRMRAQVSASAIGGEGGRSVVVRTPDNSLFSNVSNLAVLPPPAPPFTYIGLIRKRDRETAVLKNRANELISVQRNDVVGGRFRVTNISERAVEFADTELNVKHTLAFVEQRNMPGGITTSAPQQRQRRPVTTPAPANDDDQDGDDQGDDEDNP